MLLIRSVVIFFSVAARLHFSFACSLFLASVSSNCNVTYVCTAICVFDKIPLSSVHLLIRLITLLCFYDTITQPVFQGAEFNQLRVH